MKTKIKILHVDDNIHDRILVKDALLREHDGFEITEADNREKFEKLLEKGKFDLVLSDFNILGFDGLQVLEMVKEKQPDLPVIIVTGTGSEEVAIQAMKMGASDYVIKSVKHIRGLVPTINTVLEHKKAKEDRNEALKSLKESEEMYRSIYENSSVAILLTTPDGNILSANDYACRLFGRTERELCQGKREGLVDTEDPRLQVLLDERTRTGKARGELTLRKKDGSKFQCEVSSVIFPDKDGNKKTSMVIRDLTEQHKAEIELRESEEYNRLLFNTSLIGLAVSKMDGSMVDINPAFAKIIGRTIEETLKLSFKDITPEKYTAEDEKQLKSMEKTGYFGKYEKEYIHKDGHLVPVILQGIILERKGERFIWSSTEDITERKKAEIALQESQRLFQTLAQVSPVGIFRTDSDGNTNYVNPKWEELSGLSAKDASGNGWLKAVHPEDREKLSEAWLNNVKSKNESSAEYRFLRPDGSIVWVIGKAVPELTGNKVIGYIGTITDITERKQAEEDLIESEKKYRQLVIHSPDGIFVNDLSGKFISVNRSICENLKYTEKELLSMKMKDIIPDQCHSLHKQRLMAILNGEGTNTYAEYEVTGKDGITHFVEIISVPYYKGKEIIGFQSITRDITERKLAEEELKKNQSQLINALKIAHLGSWEYDVENDIFIFNDLFYEIFRTTAEQVGGYTMSSADYAKRFVHPEDIDIIRTEISKSFETDDPNFSRQLEHRIIYADGETGYINVRIFVVKDETGKTVRTYGVNQDITERKRIEAELIKATELMKLAKEKAEASDRLKTTFLNNISHEVRTPLNGILGFAEIMSQTGLSEEEKNLSRSMLLESSDRLLNTITNYMDISLITSGSIIVNRKDFVPGQIMKELFGKYNTICSGRNIELLLKSPEHSDNLSINSDPEILNKIISQLLSNAIKYTEKGSIQYGFTIRENELEFFVKDTGIGIGKESFKSIFEHFIKEDRGPLKITEGSGLGLSISKGLVVHLGGKIWVESEKGKGSCFYFTIPVEKKIAEHILIPTAVRQTKNMKTNSILVAEDDEINFFYLKALLKQNTSAEIIHASNGKVALEKYLQNPDISLILMDIKMPVMDGLEATRQIKAINRSVPIIAITAYAMPGDENRITEAGCDYYLVKPINKKLLLDKIAEYTVL